MYQKNVKIELRNFGFRTKTITCLLLCVAGAVNFLVACMYWPASATLQESVGFVGYLIFTSGGFVGAAYSESRRKQDGADTIQQLIISQGGEE